MNGREDFEVITGNDLTNREDPKSRDYPDSHEDKDQDQEDRRQEEDVRVVVDEHASGLDDRNSESDSFAHAENEQHKEGADAPNNVGSIEHVLLPLLIFRVVFVSSQVKESTTCSKGEEDDQDGSPDKAASNIFQDEEVNEAEEEGNSCRGKDDPPGRCEIVSPLDNPVTTDLAEEEIFELNEIFTNQFLSGVGIWKTESIQI